MFECVSQYFSFLWWFVVLTMTKFWNLYCWNFVSNVRIYSIWFVFVDSKMKGTYKVSYFEQKMMILCFESNILFDFFDGINILISRFLVCSDSISNKMICFVEIFFILNKKIEKTWNLLGRKCNDEQPFDCPKKSCFFVFLTF